jgi:preprotein translocase subunit YajC
MSTVLDLLASASAASQQPPAWLQFMPLVAMAGIFWFLLLRPQMRQQKEHKAKVASVKKGDQVITGGGLIGKVTKVDELYAEVEIAPNVRVKTVKSMITDILDGPGSKPAND